MNVEVTLRQIGRGNVLAISGGRFKYLTDEKGLSGIRLPVAYGYNVDIVLDPSDTYTVRRVFIRSGKVTIHTERTNVYADELGEVAYRASCYHDKEPV